MKLKLLSNEIHLRSFKTIDVQLIDFISNFINNYTILRRLLDNLDRKFDILLSKFIPNYGFRGPRGFTGLSLEPSNVSLIHLIDSVLQQIENIKEDYPQYHKSNFYITVLLIFRKIAR